MSRAPRVLLAHASADAAAVARSLPPGARWVFLAPDYARGLEWRDALGIGDGIPTAEPLAEAQDELRLAFQEKIAELGREHASLAWWTWRLSEKNTMLSPLYLRCCYLYVARSLLSSGDGPLLVVCDSSAVLESLGGEWVGRAPARPGTGFGRAAWRAARFALGAFRRKPGLGPPRAGRCVAIRTWLDDSCFGDDGEFRDRYFPGLADWFVSQGERVVIIPFFMNVQQPHAQAWRWLAENKHEFVAVADLLRFSDYAFALRLGIKQARLKLGGVQLAGLDVSRLFEEERLAVRFERGSLEAVAWARMPRRLRQAGLEVDVLVHEYEGMIDDKGLVAGVRAAMPSTRLVGFQHGSLYPPLLCNFVTAGESEFTPLPDRVVCNGEVFRDILVREGLPASIAVVGPALRYRHLHGDGAAPHSRGRRVLILLPLVPDASTELLHKSLAGLEGVDADVAVKLHPMGSREALLAAAGLPTLPPRWDWAAPAMADALSEADVVVSLGSSSLHEALAAGVPVVGVGREAALDLNPLAWFPDVGGLRRTPDAIHDEVERLLALSDEELAAYRERAREILDQSFAGDDHPMDVFYGRT